VARYLITRPQTRDDVSRNLDHMLEQAKHFGLWAIERKETGELIGRAGFYGYSMGGSLEPELAFLLRRDCWGKGLATEAARAALAHLRCVHDRGRIVATVVPDHAVSRHILEKLGLREVGSIEIRGMHVLVYATGSPGER
jgi:RimJ/RimL family protein N-acetyltransferase